MMRKSAKDIVFWALCILGIFRLFRYLNRKKAIILAYHGVTQNREQHGITNYDGKHVYVEKFVKQMDYVSKNYNVVSLDKLVGYIKTRRIPPYTLAISFDDGYKNLYDNALPVLRSYKIPATIFVITNSVDSNKMAWWDQFESSLELTVKEELEIKIDGETKTYNIKGFKNKTETHWQLRNFLKGLNEERRQQLTCDIFNQLGIASQEAYEDYQFLSWEEIAEMQRHGIAFGAHGENHIILTKIPRSRAEEEVLRSSEKLARKLGVKVESFCYPNGREGDFDGETTRILENNGFHYALLAISGMNNTNSDLYELKRIGVGNNQNFVNFLAGISGFNLCYQKIRRKFLR